MVGKIILKFKDAAIVRHNEFWFLAGDAIKVIREAKTKRVALLGFDGAQINGKFITPSMADSWDYGSQSHPVVADAYEHAEAGARDFVT